MLGEIMSGVGGVVGGLGAVANAYTNYKNYGLQVANQDYQRELQNTIFNREDTALQRRMNDARAAGVNPYAVVGSGANAGSVVGTQAPQMQGLNLGGMFDAVNSALDIVKNINQTKYQQAEVNHQNIQNANAIKEGLYLDGKLAEIAMTNKMLNQDYDLKWMDLNNAWLNMNRNLADFNIDFGTRWSAPYTVDSDGRKIFNIDQHINTWQDWYPGKDFNESYYLQDRVLGYTTNKYNNTTAYNRSLASSDEAARAGYEKDLTKKQLDWYDFGQSGNLVDKLLGYVMRGLALYSRYKR